MRIGRYVLYVYECVCVMTAMALFDVCEPWHRVYMVQPRRVSVARLVWRVYDE